MNDFTKGRSAPWTVQLFINGNEASIKYGNGLKRTEKGIIQVEENSLIRVPLTIIEIGSVIVRVAYDRTPPDTESEICLVLGSDIMATEYKKARAPGVSFLFHQVPPGDYMVELIHKAKPNTEIPIRGIAAGSARDHIDKASLRQLDLFLRWLARASYETGRPLPRSDNLTISSSGSTRECFLLLPNDTIEVALPYDVESRPFWFEYSGLIIPSHFGAMIHVETRQNGRWKSYGKSMVNRKPPWNQAVVYPSEGRKMGDAIRMFSDDPQAIIAISEPALLAADNNSSRWNLILIDLDTARADRFGCYGYVNRPTTAELDSKLHEKGFLLFDRAYAPATWTLSSTAKFLSSRYLHANLRPCP